jgi:hypothetical protein
MCSGGDRQQQKFDRPQKSRTTTRHYSVRSKICIELEAMPGHMHAQGFNVRDGLLK